MKTRQDGIALLGLLAVIVLGASWWLVSALATPASRVASDREHNAKVLAQAKLALIGTVGLVLWAALVGWGVLDWWADFLPSPRDKDAEFILTNSQAREILEWFRLDPATGRYVYRRGYSRRERACFRGGFCHDNGGKREARDP